MTFVDIFAKENVNIHLGTHRFPRFPDILIA